MTAGIAHEVNNPLGSILLYSELLLGGDMPDRFRKDLKTIHNEARRATRIMNDLLTYSRRVKPQMRRINLHKTLRKVLGMRQYQHSTQNITQVASLPDEPLYVKGDPAQLVQVFMNLILNAEEALRKSGGGSITVTARADRDWAKISVADNGTGIPEEILGQIFYPFFTTKPAGDGTGLGLSTCYGIVTGHNGLIKAENNEMGGATFTVELPLAEVRG
jgi:signal transduction histidine kinase